jgi:hypothetical protein
MVRVWDQKSESTLSEESGSKVEENIKDVVEAPERAKAIPENLENDPSNVRFVYQAFTCSKEHSTFDPEPKEFRGF